MSYPVGAEHDSNAPYNESTAVTKNVIETIPVWKNEDEQIKVLFTLEIFENVDEDLIIDVIKCDQPHFIEGWEDDIRDYIYGNYNYIEELNFKL